MTHRFVEYLNSMNNVDGNTTGSLAEKQVVNKFYNKIHVKRKLGSFIKRSIECGENKIFFITGHAGDGKTSILAQILKELNLVVDKKLKEVELVENDKYKVFYIKDMSELEESRQEELIKKALSIPNENGTSIVISNTGPLINTMKKINPDLESEVIEQLDNNEGEEIKVGDKLVTIINLARIDNVDFIDEILDKLIDDELWKGCENCGKDDICHISFNRKLIREYKSRITKFIKSYYRWLYENDQRLTIRQMVAHLTYMITANKSCEQLKNTSNHKYVYNLANNLFGYRGIADEINTNQIEAINKIKTLRLDKISLDEDYQLFVRDDYSFLPDEIAEMVNSRWTQYEKECRKVDEKGTKFNRYKAIEIRKCIRRFFLVFGYYGDEIKSDKVMDEIFGETFTLYKKCILEPKTRDGIREIRDVVFNGLRKLNFDGSDDQNREKLYLTLKRHDGSFQSVMLIIGEIEKRDLEIKAKNIKTRFDDINYKNELYLTKKGEENIKYRLNYQLIEYFNSVLNGAVETKASPMITCGIAKLDSWLNKNFKVNQDEEYNKLELLIKTTSGIKTERLELDNGKIYLD
ncbi:hypothetical protein [Clostridium baratii]|uniref:hypothetical protein n=1 Tax=Clostridium baratii TaxID=1561 RepID=UPI003D327DB9